MRLKEYIKLIRSKAWIIILSTVAFMLIAGIVCSFLITPVYEANTTLIVDINQSQENIDTVTGEQLSSSQKLTVIYGEIIKSRAVLDKVAKELDLDISGNEISNRVTITQIKDTQMMNISVVDENPKQAKDIANTIPVIFKEEAKRIVKANDVQVIDKALEPTRPIKPNTIVTVSVSGIVGFVIGICEILVLEYMNDKIRKKSDIKNNLDLRVLGLIPYIKNLDSNNTSNELMTEVYRNLRSEIKFSKSSPNIKSILITSSNDDEGKTTVVTNLAKSFSEIDNKKILIIDSDMKNPNVHRIFNIDNTNGLSDILLNKTTIDNCIKNSKINQLDVLVAGEYVNNSSELLSVDKFKIILDELKVKYDYIFIDSHSISMATDASLIANFSDATILIIGANEVDIEVCKSSKDKLEYAQSNIIGCILNKYKDN